MKMMEAEEEKADISQSSSLSNATTDCTENVLTNDSKYQRVSKVSVKRQLDWVSS